MDSILRLFLVLSGLATIVLVAVTLRRDMFFPKAFLHSGFFHINTGMNLEHKYETDVYRHVKERQYTTHNIHALMDTGRGNETDIYRPMKETTTSETEHPHTVVSSNMTSSPPKPQKYLIYLCHKKQICGGWADRQRGLVSLFVLSLVTERQFGIAMDNPCSITHFYRPKDVNWIISPQDLQGKSRTVINDISSRARLSTRLSTMDFNEEYPQDVVYVKTNNAVYPAAIRKNKRYFPKLPKWAQSNSNSNDFGNAWKVLMQPSESLQRQLDAYKKSINFDNRTQPLVCSHVRIGKSSTFKTDLARMAVSDIKYLWDFLDGYVQNGSTLFMATDNYEVRTLTRERFGASVSDTGGAIVHVDRPGAGDDVCQGFGFAVLDQLILTHCDVLILTPSGFGKRAALIRGTGENLFQFHNKKVQKSKL